MIELCVMRVCVRMYWMYSTPKMVGLQTVVWMSASPTELWARVLIAGRQARIIGVAESNHLRWQVSNFGASTHFCAKSIWLWWSVTICHHAKHNCLHKPRGSVWLVRGGGSIHRSMDRALFWTSPFWWSNHAFDSHDLCSRGWLMFGTSHAKHDQTTGSNGSPEWQ